MNDVYSDVEIESDEDIEYTERSLDDDEESYDVIDDEDEEAHEDTEEDY